MHNSLYFKVKQSFLLLGLCCSSLAFSGTPPAVIAFEEGERFDFTLSSINYNRVYVEGETIIKLSYPQGSISLDESEKERSDIEEKSVYIKPNFEVPVTLFVTTDKGHHFSLTLTPDETYGKTLRLIPKNQTRVAYVTPHVTEPSEHEAIMAAMKEGLNPKDFNAIPTVPRPFYVKKDLKVTLVKQYKGADLAGYVYKIENTSNHEIALSTDLFSHRKAQSLALSEEQLAPKKVAYLYGLYRNEG